MTAGPNAGMCPIPHDACPADFYFSRGGFIGHADHGGTDVASNVNDDRACREGTRLCFCVVHQFSSFVCRVTSGIAAPAGILSTL